MAAYAMKPESEEHEHLDELEEEDDEAADDLSTCSNLIVNYLPPTMSETELRRLFAPHGTIQHVKVVTDRVSGRSRTCASCRRPLAEQRFLCHLIRTRHPPDRRHRQRSARERPWRPNLQSYRLRL